MPPTTTTTRRKTQNRKQIAYAQCILVYVYAHIYTYVHVYISSIAINSCKHILCMYVQVNVARAAAKKMYINPSLCRKIPARS